MRDRAVGLCLVLGALLGVAGCDGAAAPADAGMDATYFEEESWTLPDAGSDVGTDAGTDATFFEEEWIPPDTGMDAMSFDDAPPVVPDAAVGDVGPSPCAFVDTLVRSCSTDSDCEVVVHQSDCCGNTSALGVTHDEAARFDALEPICRDSYPPCGCPAHPTVTDSGESAPDPTSIQVGCISRGPGAICLTYVSMRPPDGF
ncbi:MAG: hypothetical protein K1X94_08115 [Sandaracinaceae bacterium]|nr:hypothetical protein [Sandaracinaceae bacterium]